MSLLFMGLGSIPVFQQYVVVGASCSLNIKRGQDARTTNLKIWDAPWVWGFKNVRTLIA